VDVPLSVEVTMAAISFLFSSQGFPLLSPPLPGIDRVRMPMISIRMNPRTWEPLSSTIVPIEHRGQQHDCRTNRVFPEEGISVVVKISVANVDRVIVP